MSSYDEALNEQLDRRLRAQEIRTRRTRQNPAPTSAIYDIETQLAAASTINAQIVGVGQVGAAQSLRITFTEDVTTDGSLQIIGGFYSTTFQTGAVIDITDSKGYRWFAPQLPAFGNYRTNYEHLGFLGLASAGLGGGEVIELFGSVRPTVAGDYSVGDYIDMSFYGQDQLAEVIGMAILISGVTSAIGLRTDWSPPYSEVFADGIDNTGGLGANMSYVDNYSETPTPASDCVCLSGLVTRPAGDSPVYTPVQAGGIYIGDYSGTNIQVAAHYMTVPAETPIDPGFTLSDGTVSAVGNYQFINVH